MLKKTGDTMTGTLNQRTPAGVTPAYILTSPDIDLSQSSTAYQSGGLIIFRDKNNKDGNYISSYVDQYGANVLTLQASIGVDDNRKTTGVGIWIKQNGESGSWAFPCNINNSILTTVAHGSNYVKLGNGLIICWATADNLSHIYSNNWQGTITFPIAFKTIPYVSAFMTDGGSPDSRWWNSLKVVLSGTSTTGFHLCTGSTEAVRINWIAIGY